MRRRQSAWSFVEPAVTERFVAGLAGDLASGAWNERYGDWRSRAELDGSLRLVVG